MSNLYQLSNDYMEIFNAVCESADDETGEVDTALVEQLNAIQGAFEAKAINVAYLYRECDDEIIRIDRLMERLTKRKKRLASARERIKEYLSTAMQNAGVDSVKGDYATLSFRSSEETVIDNIAFLSDEFFIVKKEVSKTAIKQAIKQGREVLGAHIERKRNLQIK